MVGRAEDQTLCPVCAGEQRHPADQQKRQAQMGGRVLLTGMYDTAPDLSGAQGGSEALHARRAAERKAWAG